MIINHQKKFHNLENKIMARYMRECIIPILSNLLSSQEADLRTQKYTHLLTILDEKKKKYQQSVSYPETKVILPDKISHVPQPRPTNWYQEWEEKNEEHVLGTVEEIEARRQTTYSPIFCQKDEVYQPELPFLFDKSKER